ncbi:hypothetical protein GBA65_15130 [Rubrobacter marinus]|uniref:SWIM-type domain-containing protein n=1 Tax=Rubrobacter marinus TaxID=2653852 RepID=A0A6G8PZV7_9ACTN|nr:hypothetical protein [Rubrobacter marinus]QIN79637.1 hypothetical protein GBA65_15130 [Rubrobacter marinus]
MESIPTTRGIGEGIARRIRSGIALFADHHEGMAFLGGSGAEARYSVPSRSRPGLKRFVRLSGEGDSCTCPDFSCSGLGCCAHTVAAMIADSKRVEHRVEARHDSRFGEMFDLVEYRGGRRSRVVAVCLSYNDALMARMDLAGFPKAAA